MNLDYWLEHVKATAAIAAHLAVPIPAGAAVVYLPIVAVPMAGGRTVVLLPTRLNAY